MTCRIAKLSLICLSMLANGVPSAAGAADVFPGYAGLCGFPIIVAATPSVAQAVTDGAGRPVIVIDPSLNAEVEHHRRTFLIAHECAHHRMGHLSGPARSQRLASRRVVSDQEMSADCWAAETLARAGIERPLRIMADRFFRAGLYSPGAGYPAGVQRSTIIQQCAAVGRQARHQGTAQTASGTE